MSETTKPMVVWAHPDDVESVANPPKDTHVIATVSAYAFPEDQAHLLLPIEDGALRVGDWLFRPNGAGIPEIRRQDDPEGEWVEATDEDVFHAVFRPLMDAVEGVGP